MQLQKKLLEILFKKTPKKENQEEEINKEANLDPFEEGDSKNINQEEEK
jgi:hypothetical protein